MKNIKHPFKLIAAGKKTWLILVCVILMLGMMVSPAFAQQTNDGVTFVMFFSPKCSHCHKMLEEVILPMVKASSGEINVLMINTLEDTKDDLYVQTTRELNKKADGIPAILIGKTFLVGETEISQQLPGLVEQAKTDPAYATPQVSVFANLSTISQKSYAYLMNKSNVGQVNADGTLGERTVTWETILLVLTLIVLAVTLLTQGYALAKRATWQRGKNLPNLNLYLVFLGIGLLIALYLTYTELTPQQPYCLGSDGCGLVENSGYALILGVVPTALLGVLSYLVLGALLVYYLRLRKPDWALDRYVPMSFNLLLMVNIAFLIWLNYLELAVIGALCIWCWFFGLTNIVLSWITLSNGGLESGQPRRTFKRHTNTSPQREGGVAKGKKS